MNSFSNRLLVIVKSIKDLDNNSKKSTLQNVPVGCGKVCNLPGSPHREGS